MTARPDVRSVEAEGPPTRALLLSLLALLVPVIGTYFLPNWTSRDIGILAWLLALLPSFLLAYYHGWKGASLALAAAMVAYVCAQIVVIVRGAPLPSVGLMLSVTAALIAISLGAGALATLLKRQLEAAQDMALTDAATGLPNRRYAMLHLRRAFAAAVRGSDLTVVLFDLDRLRGLTNQWGHGVSDDVLRLFARVLASNTRDMHLSARLDGEEFMTVLDGSDLDGATVFAQSVLSEWSGTEVPWGSLSAVAGLAGYRRDMDSPETLIAAAEQALHRARSSASGPGLALSRSDEVDPLERSDPSGPGTRPGSGETILVVDDDPGVLRVLMKLLRRAGYRPLSASSPEAGHRIAAENLGGVDLVVVDIVMPGSSGFGFVERLREGSARPVPVLYISGYDQDEIRWEGVPGEPKAFQAKPLQTQQFLATVRRLLDESLEGMSNPGRTAG